MIGKRKGAQGGAREQQGAWDGAQAARRTRTRSPLKAVVAIVAIVVVVLYVATAVQIGRYAQGYAIDYDARDYIYSAEYGRYGRLYETAVQDMARDASYSAEVGEYRALAFYYEQAVLEHAYRAAGDVRRADGFAARMGEYEAQLGSMSAHAASVRRAVAGDEGV